MRLIYAAPHIDGSAAEAIHIDALRWRALYDAFVEIGWSPKPVSVGALANANDADGLKAALSNDAPILIHHEFTLKRMAGLLGQDELVALLRQRRCFLQADAVAWDWLGLDAEAILPAFVGVGVAGALAAKERGFHHIQLGCQRLPSVFDANSDTVVYVGRYDQVFNERTRAIASVLRECGMTLRFVTYKKHQAALEPILPECPNIVVHDAVPYAQLAEAVGPARFGLAFRRHEDPNGKVWDYLAMGLPVLYEQMISESEFLAANGAGIGFRRNDQTGLADSIRDFRAPDMSALRDQNTWAMRAREWTALLSGA